MRREQAEPLWRTGSRARGDGGAAGLPLFPSLGKEPLSFSCFWLDRPGRCLHLFPSECQEVQGEGGGGQVCEKAAGVPDGLHPAQQIE